MITKNEPVIGEHGAVLGHIERCNDGRWEAFLFDGLPIGLYPSSSAAALAVRECAAVLTS